MNRTTLPTDGTPMSSNVFHQALADLRDLEKVSQPDFLGYQANQNLHFSDFGDLLNVQLNNLGDPFTEGSFRLNTKGFERALLDYLPGSGRPRPLGTPRTPSPTGATYC